MRYATTDRERQEQDKQLARITKDLKEEFPQTPICLVLQSDLEKNFRSDPQYDDIKIYKNRELSEHILASSVENLGFQTMLTHLLTMKQK
jgi:hypothetical protein